MMMIIRFFSCMSISRQNLWTIWSAFQHEIVIGQSRARHCVMTLDESTKINFNRKRVIYRNEHEQRQSVHQELYLVYRKTGRETSIEMCHYCADNIQSSIS